MMECKGLNYEIGYTYTFMMRYSYIVVNYSCLNEVEGLAVSFAIAEAVKPEKIVFESCALTTHTRPRLDNP